MAVMTMEIVLTDSAKIAFRTLSAREQDRVQGLLAALKNWDHDPHIQKVSQPLIYKDVYVLKATDGMRIFYNKGAEQILILDIAKKKTVDQFADAE
jgi:mRNA-degrading endonuclease RelE of RelBE toxin-antitoxin system